MSSALRSVQLPYILLALVICCTAIPLELLTFPAPLYEQEGVTTCPAADSDCLDPGFPDPPPVRAGVDTSRLCVLHNVTTVLPQKIVVNYTSDECRPDCAPLTMLTLEQKGVRKCVEIDTKWAKHLKVYKIWFGAWVSSCWAGLDSCIVGVACKLHAALHRKRRLLHQSQSGDARSSCCIDSSVAHSHWASGSTCSTWCSM